MTPLAISFLVLLCIFGSAMIGLLVRPRIPDEHLNSETKEVVKLVVGIVGTMTGMVLGLLVASAKSSFDDQRNGIAQLSANVVVVDRALAHYGTETKEARDELRNSVNDMIQRIWSEDAPSPIMLLMGSLVVSSAVFLILELDHPFDGIMHLSSQPLKNALLELGR